MSEEQTRAGREPWSERMTELVPGHGVDDADLMIRKLFSAGKSVLPGTLQVALEVARDALEYRRALHHEDATGWKFSKVEEGATLASSDRDERRPVVVPEDRVHPVHDPSWYSFGEKRMWIPWAKDALTGPARGRYQSGYPSGMVVHWTAGHRNGLTAGNQLMRSTGCLYLLADAEGLLAQSNALSHWGYHAGASAYPGLRGTVSDELVGLELQCWGKLTVRNVDRRPSWWSWAGYEIPAEQVEMNWKDKAEANIERGYYHAITSAQLHTLRRTACWLHLNHPDVFRLGYVLGHDEVSPGRKCDPGGSLGMTMPQLRELLQEDVDQIKSAAKRKG